MYRLAVPEGGHFDRIVRGLFVAEGDCLRNR